MKKLIPLLMVWTVFSEEVPLDFSYSLSLVTQQTVVAASSSEDTGCLDDEDREEADFLECSYKGSGSGEYKTLFSGDAVFRNSWAFPISVFSWLSARYWSYIDASDLQGSMLSLLPTMGFFGNRGTTSALEYTRVGEDGWATRVSWSSMKVGHVTESMSAEWKGARFDGVSAGIGRYNRGENGWTAEAFFMPTLVKVADTYSVGGKVQIGAWGGGGDYWSSRYGLYVEADMIEFIRVKGASNYDMENTFKGLMELGLMLPLSGSDGLFGVGWLNPRMDMSMRNGTLHRSSGKVVGYNTFAMGLSLTF